jgi:hypothetical protein
MPDEENLRDGIDEAIGKSTAMLAAHVSLLGMLLRKRLLTSDELPSMLAEALRIIEGVPEMSESSRVVAKLWIQTLTELRSPSDSIQ